MPISPLNDPAVIAEIAAHHDAYERALVANDVAALNASFWDSPHVVRFGVSEHLYGAEAIAAYRSDSPPSYVNRRVTRRSIVTFGADVAIVMCEVSQTINGQPRESRQSQQWIRFPEAGWKIVAAHVSHATAPHAGWNAYVDRVSAVVGLPIDAAHRAGVAQNLQRAALIAAPLLEFQLSTDAEAAPVFTP